MCNCDCGRYACTHTYRMASPTSHHRLLNQQILQLPHKQDGTINYAVLGNMLTATMLREVLEVSFVDKEFGRSSDQRLPSSESDWEFHYKENDVTVYRKNKPDCKTHCFLGRGVIDVPLHCVVGYIHKFHTRLEWDDFLMQIEICKAISDIDWIYYMAHEATQCLFTSKRDFLLYSRTAYVDGKYVQTALSIEDKNYPHRPPYIRAEIMEGSGWLLEKYKGNECSTLATYVANFDLKELPASLMDRVIKRQPMAIHHIRKKLTMQNSEQIPRSLSDGSQQLPPQVNVSVPFEDSIPVQHYTSTGIDKPDCDTPMYPWATDKQTVATKKKFGRREQKVGGSDKLFIGRKTPLTDTSNSTSSLTHSIERQQDDDKRLSDSVESGVASTIVLEKGEGNDDQGDPTTNSSPVVFPSFSAWAKNQ